MGTEKRLAELQRAYMDKDARKEEREFVHQSWFNEGTVDFWRHKRMYDTIQSFAEHYKTGAWLTIGDGRFGLDSIRLKSLFNLSDILPTDIAGNMLEISKQKGYIDRYSVENAEHLSFFENSFDVVFCKESFHHFPRPYLALYEMIRVSKQAIVLIEPAERLHVSGAKAKPYLQSAFQLLASKILRKSFLPYVPPITDLNHGYEEAGNYLYAVSIREMEKLVYGLDLCGMAYKRYNDTYIKGCEFEQAINGNPVFEEIKISIKNGDKICSTHPQYYQPNMVSVILFKNDLGEPLRGQMKADGYFFIEKVANPYI